VQNRQLRSMRIAGPTNPPSLFAASRKDERTIAIIGAPRVAERFERAIKARASDLIVEPASSLSDAGGRTPDVLLLEVRDSRTARNRLHATLSEIRRRHADAPIMLIAGDEDMAFASTALRMGVRGIVSKDLPDEIVIAAVRLVLAGGTFIPPGLVEYCQGKPANVPADLGRARLVAQLTQRELEILEQVRACHPNKVIAYQLRMSESTVKTHLRNIMRKAKAKNRTELALFVDAVGGQ
jgi:DNA-binding NarL/FixJ family response regulator